MEIVDQLEELDPSKVVEDSLATTEISMQVFLGTFNPREIRLTSFVLG